MTVHIRSSTLADLDLHCRHRVAMFRDMEMGDDAGMVRMTESFRPQLRTWLTTGQARGFVVEVDGVAVAGALLQLKEVLPTPVSEQQVRGHLFNVYCEPEHRGQGHARRLTEAAIACAKDLGLGVLELHASLAAEALYKSMGFVPTSEMRMVLDPDIKTPKQWTNRR